MSSSGFRCSTLKLGLLAWLAGWASLALAQLPPPDLLLTEPHPAVLILGPMDVHVRASLMFVYDDNISLHEQPQVQEGIQTRKPKPPLGDDFITTISPGIRLTKAATIENSSSALAFDYSPSFLFFLKNSEENSVDHSARLDGGYGFTKLTLGLVQEFNSTAGGVVDVGARVSQKNYRTGVTARYEMTEKTFLLADAGYRLTDYETQTDSEEWSSTATANYQVSPKLTLGLGASYGQLIVSEQSQFTYTNTVATNSVTRTTPRGQTHVGPTMRLGYKTSAKTDLNVSLGGEWRFYPDDSTSFSPVFSVAGSYRPFEGTALSIEAHRREQNSAVINGANYISTGISFSARQQFQERISGTISFTYDNSEYVAARRGVNPTRNDDYFLLRYGLEAIIGRSWTIGVFHQYRKDISTDKSFSFSNNQVGIQAAWQL